MPQWQSSTRRDRLPADWVKIRSKVLKRDGRQCQYELEDGNLCLDEAREVDHIKAGDDHREINLRAICTWHHRIKSSSEGGAALQARRREIKRRFVRTESHPGLI